MTTITRREACELVRTAIGKTDVPEENIKRIIYAVNNDIQVRDFLLGIPMHYSAIDCAKLLRSIVDVADPQEAVPFATILAAYAYEAGDLDSVAKSLSFAYSADPSYSLTKLLMRVTASGWPKEAFIKMREELHLKVMATCYGPEGDEVINPVRTEEEEE
jgi:hypothetical protein